MAEITERKNRGRPKHSERVLNVRVPVSLLPALEEAGHGDASLGAETLLLAHLKSNLAANEAIASQMADASALLKRLESYVDLYETERQRWMGDLVGLVKTGEDAEGES